MTASLVSQMHAASRVFRAMVEANPDAHERVAAAQRSQLELAISRSSGFKIEEVASMTDAVLESDFPEPHKGFLLTSVCSTEAVMGDGSSKFQDWTSMMQFPPSSIVAMQGTPAFAPNFFRFLLRGGLRNPGEYTFREMALILMIASRPTPAGVEEAMLMASDTRTAFVESTKVLWRRSAKGIPPSAVRIDILPASPDFLRRSHPELYDQLYNDDPPSSVDVDEVSLEMLRGGTRCRKVKTTHIATISSRTPSGSGTLTIADVRTEMLNVIRCIVPQRAPDEPRINVFKPKTNFNRAETFASESELGQLVVAPKPSRRLPEWGPGFMVSDGCELDLEKQVAEAEKGRQDKKN